MATYLGKGYFNGGANIYLEVQWELIRQSIANNTSTYKLWVYVGSEGGWSGSGSTAYIYPHGEGTTGNACGSFSSVPKNSRVGPGISEEFTVTHDSLGKKSIYVYVDCSCNWTNMGYASAGGTITFPDIPRTSSIDATDSYVESASTINITRAVDTFTHTLTYSFDGLTGTIGTEKTTETNIGWIIPSSFYAKLTNTRYDVGKTCTITCETFNGNTSIGTSTKDITITVNPTSNNTKPTVSGTFTLDSTTKSLNGNLNTHVIKGITDVTVSMTATAKNGASISSKTTVCGDGKSISANGTMNDVESASFVVTATDSRGITNSATYNTMTLVDYVTLTMNPTFYRTSPTNNTIALTFTGNYFNNKFGTASSTQNTLTIQYQYKLSTASSWSSLTTLTKTISGNTYSNGSSAITLGTNFDYTKEYDFRIIATDKVGSVTVEKRVTQGIPVFDWGKSDFKFNVPIYQASGNVIPDYTVVDTW